MKRLFGFVLLSLMLPVCVEAALRQVDKGPCSLSQKTLSNPEAVLQDLLENSERGDSTNCFETFSADSEPGPLPGPHYPTKGTKFKKAAGFGGIYRDFKIYGWQAGPSLEGYETRTYDVGMIHVAVERDAPTQATCEKSRVPMRMVNTPWGWRLMTKHLFGSNLNTYIKMLRQVNVARPWDKIPATGSPQRFSDPAVKELEAFAAQCKLKLE